MRKWPPLRKKPDIAIAIGVGAGAVEAFLLGAAGLASVVFAVSPGAENEELRQQLTNAQATIPLYWLLGPVERLLALLAHVGCRALVLVGAPRGRWRMVAAGLLLFAGVDAVAGVYHFTGKKVSMWWVELAIVPFALTGLFAAQQCRVVGRAPMAE